MYDSGPTQEELDAIGLCREDVEDTSVIEIWPENLLAFDVFNKMRSQWNVGMSGASSLNYASLPLAFKRCKVSKKQFDEVFDSIQIMESTALNKMHQK